ECSFGIPFSFHNLLGYSAAFDLDFISILAFPKKLYRHCHELHQGLLHFLYEGVPCLIISHCVVQSIMCMLCLSQLLKAVSHILFQSLSEPCQRCWTKAERVFAYIGMKVIIHIAPIKSSIIAYKAYRLTISNINNPIEEGIHSL